jgi:hypothetical protein
LGFLLLSGFKAIFVTRNMNGGGVAVLFLDLLQKGGSGLEGVAGVAPVLVEEGDCVEVMRSGCQQGGVLIDEG